MCVLLLEILKNYELNMLLLCSSVRLSGRVCTRLADCDTLDQAAADGGDMSALV